MKGKIPRFEAPSFYTHPLRIFENCQAQLQLQLQLQLELRLALIPISSASPPPNQPTSLKVRNMHNFGIFQLICLKLGM